MEPFNVCALRELCVNPLAKIFRQLPATKGAMPFRLGKNYRVQGKQVLNPRRATGQFLPGGMYPGALRAHAQRKTRGPARAPAAFLKTRFA